jgi:dolichyl-diphosphooligosaccharide--protein glycosyltransferase
MSGVLRSALNGAFSALRSIDRRVRGPGLVELSVLSLAVASAFMVRVLPGRWGPILSELDL